MSDLTNAEWLDVQRKAYAERINAIAAFWPEFQRACKEYSEAEPFKDLVRVHADRDEPRILILSAGLFDLKVACDAASDMVIYAFTSATMKKLVPRESAIFSTGTIRLTRGYWGVIDMPHDGAPQSFVGDPQAVEKLPLADRFARWCFEQLIGGYGTINLLALRENQKTARKQDAYPGDKLREEHGL